MSIPHENCRRIVVEVDTHKHNHVAVALDQVGAVLGSTTTSVNRAGNAQLSEWAVGLAAEHDSAQVLFGIEGTGSYGAGLASGKHHHHGGNCGSHRSVPAASTTPPAPAPTTGSSMPHREWTDEDHATEPG